MKPMEEGCYGTRNVLHLKGDVIAKKNQISKRQLKGIHSDGFNSETLVCCIFTPCPLTQIGTITESGNLS